MSFEQVLQFLRWLLGGGKDGVEPFLAHPHALLLVFSLALLVMTGDLVRRALLWPAVGTFLLAGLLASAFYIVHTDKAGPTRADAKVSPPPGPTIPSPKSQHPPAASPNITPPPPVAPDFHIHDGHTLIGGDLRSAADLRQQRISLQACQSRCADDVACLAFSFDKAENSCVLKGAVTERKPFAAAVSGIKRGSDVSGGKR